MNDTTPNATTPTHAHCKTCTVRIDAIDNVRILPPHTDKLLGGFYPVRLRVTTSKDQFVLYLPEAERFLTSLAQNDDFAHAWRMRDEMHRQKQDYDAAHE